MLRRLSSYFKQNVVAFMALFVALGGTAYAVDTIRSSDIVDNEVYPADVRNDNLAGGGLTGSDIANGAVTTLEVRDDNQPFGGLYSQDLASGSVTSSELAPFTINEGDIASNVIVSRHINGNAVNSGHVSDGTLNDEDIGPTALVNFQAVVGTVNQRTCRFDLLVSGINAQGDHLLLTPNYATADPNLIYNIQYVPNAEYARLRVCNPTNANIDDGNTNFNLLVIDAQ